MTEQEKEEALAAMARHYGMPLFLEMVDQIVDRIAGGVLSIPIDKDPKRASLTLYAERMKGEGAHAVRMSLRTKIENLKMRMKEEKK